MIKRRIEIHSLSDKGYGCLLQEHIVADVDKKGALKDSHPWLCTSW